MIYPRVVAVILIGFIPHAGGCCAVEPVGEALPPKVFEKDFRDRDEPFLRSVVTVELVGKGKEVVVANRKFSGVCAWRAYQREQHVDTMLTQQ